jgi:hypothetical protein
MINIEIGGLDTLQGTNGTMYIASSHVLRTISLVRYSYVHRKR